MVHYTKICFTTQSSLYTVSLRKSIHKKYESQIPEQLDTFNSELQGQGDKNDLWLNMSAYAVFIKSKHTLQ